MAALNSLTQTITDDPISGMARVMVHDSFTIGKDLQMIHKIIVTKYMKDENGIPTVPAKDFIETSSDYTREQKDLYINGLGDTPKQATTAGNLVNPLTGIGEPAPEEGQPDLRIEEIEFWQGITLENMIPLLTLEGIDASALTGVTVKVSDIVYTLLKKSMTDLVARGRV